MQYIQTIEPFDKVWSSLRFVFHKSKVHLHINIKHDYYSYFSWAQYTLYHLFIAGESLFFYCNLIKCWLHKFTMRKIYSSFSSKHVKGHLIVKIFKKNFIENSGTYLSFFYLHIYHYVLKCFSRLYARTSPLSPALSRDLILHCIIQTLACLVICYG